MRLFNSILLKELGFGVTRVKRVYDSRLSDSTFQQSQVVVVVVLNRSEDCFVLEIVLHAFKRRKGTGTLSQVLNIILPC